MVKKDQVQVSVEVDGKQGINELGKLEMEAKELKASLKELKKNTEEWNQANNRLKEVSAEMGRLREQIGLTGMTMRQLTTYQRELQREWNGLTRGTQEFARVDAELKRVNSTIAHQRAELKGTSGVWGFLKSEIGKFGALALGALGVDALIGQINNLISRNAKLSDSLADIRKTTGLSAEGVDQLNQKLGELNTRTSKNDLLEIAKSGGQLGIASKDILAFTQAMDKLNVALGDEFGSAEQITKDMGALRNIFTDIKSDKIDEDMLRIGNAINELGATGAATGDVVADMAGRIGGVGVPLGLAAGEVLGLSATMQELNINTERGSTAVVKILQKMGTDYKEFAKVAGMETQAFKQLLDKDLFGAFTKVVEGVGKTKGGMAEFSATMDRLKIDGAGASELVGKLSGNMDLLRGRVDLANGSLKNTDSIMNEFNIKNETFGAQIEKIGKRLSGVFVNSAIMNGMKTFVGYLSDITEIKVSEAMMQEQAELSSLVLAITSVNDEYGTRKRLLDELKNRFPDFLGDLNTETVTNEQLQQALEKVNKEYLNKIFIQTNQEKMNEFAKEELELLNKLASLQKQMKKEGNDFRVLPGGEVRRLSEDFQIDITQTKQALQELKQERADFMKGQKEMADMLGIDVSKPGTAPASGTKQKTTPTTSVGDEVDAKAQAKAEKARLKQQKIYNDALQDLQKHLADMDKVLEENEIKRELILAEKKEKELAIIDQQFMAEIQKAEEYNKQAQESKVLSDEDKLRAENEFNQKIYELNLQWIEATNLKKAELDEAERLKKEELQNQINLLTMSKDEQEIEQVKAKYQALIDEADRYGLNTIAIYEAMHAEIVRIKTGAAAKEQKATLKTQKTEQESYRLRAQAAAQLYGALSGMLGAFIGDAFQYSAAAKALALAEIMANQGAAISAATASGAKAEAQTPSFGARGFAQFASVMAIILSGIGQAVTVLSREAPQMPSTTTMTGRGFAEGGFTGTSPIGFDKDGPVAGVVHTGEYVIPARMLQQPQVMNVTRALEAMRLGGGQTTEGKRAVNRFAEIDSGKRAVNRTAGGGEIDSGKRAVNSTDPVLVEIRDLLRQRQQVVFVQTEYERFQEDQNSIKFSAQK